jgi:ribosomal protein S17
MKLILTTSCAAALMGAGILGAAGQTANPSNASKEVTQDTKTITNSGTTTTNTDTIYGKVESYNLNKSIKVSVPGKVVTSKSFDLSAKNETVNIAPKVKVGDWVSIQRMTDNTGHKTLTIEHTNERASR